MPCVPKNKVFRLFCRGRDPLIPRGIGLDSKRNAPHRLTNITSGAESGKGVQDFVTWTSKLFQEMSHERLRETVVAADKSSRHPLLMLDR